MKNSSFVLGDLDHDCTRSEQFHKQCELNETQPK